MSEFAQEHLHQPKRFDGPLSMVWTVTVLAVLSTIAGFLQFQPFWTPITTWLDPVAAPTADPSGTQEAIASVCAVGLGLAGMWVAYAMYAAKSLKVPKPVALFEHKFYWDELYDAIFYKPGVLVAQVARALRRAARDRRLDHRGHAWLPDRLR